jgi:hypothetical protein
MIFLAALIISSALVMVAYECSSLPFMKISLRFVENYLYMTKVFCSDFIMSIGLALEIWYILEKPASYIALALGASNSVNYIKD